MLVKIRCVDREGRAAQQIRGNLGHAACPKQCCQTLNLPKEATRSEWTGAPMKDRTCGQLDFERCEQVLTCPVIDNAMNEHEARVRQFSRHAAAQRTGVQLQAPEGARGAGDRRRLSAATPCCAAPAQWYSNKAL